MHITTRIERVLIRSKIVLICCGHWLSDGWIEEEKMFYQNNGVFLALCSTMYVQLDFQENLILLVSLRVFFHGEMFGVNNFGIVLQISIVHEMIFFLEKKF